MTTTIRHLICGEVLPRELAAGPTHLATCPGPSGGGVDRPLPPTVGTSPRGPGTTAAGARRGVGPPAPGD